MSIGRAQDEANQHRLASTRTGSVEWKDWPRPCRDPDRCLWRPCWKGQPHTHCSFLAGAR